MVNSEKGRAFYYVPFAITRYAGTNVPLSSSFHKFSCRKKDFKNALTHSERL